MTLSHPLYAHVIWNRPSQLAVDHMMGAQIAKVSELGARRLDDPVKVAIRQLGGGGQADPELLVRAARLSRGANDFPRVKRLARAALTAADPTSRSDRRPDFRIGSAATRRPSGSPAGTYATQS
ncbi:hypothetical protein Pth03_39060 [Planotetraspora thailandica]|uniref:Uncharacterized protein n=1 Tax=Planotetraspora thailandica TaxID=487172 RepID=A0A8J3V1G0_9ACTN|nr:hypothetical protein Pth03_39060 [Planotetraspora thailandica]